MDGRHAWWGGTSADGGAHDAARQQKRDPGDDSAADRPRPQRRVRRRCRTTLNKVVASGPNARWPAWERLCALLHFGEGLGAQAAIESTLDVIERQVVREDWRSADGLRALVTRHVIDAMAHWARTPEGVR
jgi:hypothetical protein